MFNSQSLDSIKMHKRFLHTFLRIQLIFLSIISIGTVAVASNASIPDEHIIIRFDFSQMNGSKVVDISSNGFEATLYNSAKVVTIGTDQTGIYNVLDLGSVHGLMNIGEEAGEKFCQLNDYSVGAFFRIDNDHEFGEGGSPLFSFSNSLYANSGNDGIITLTLANLGYEITPTNRTDADYAGTKLNQGAFQGDWHHVLYTQNNNIGKIYLDGSLVASDTIETVPADLYSKYGSGTSFNFIGHSGFSTEKYLDRSLIYDFCVMDYALSDDEIKGSELSIAERIKSLNEAVEAYRATSKTSETNVKAIVNKGTPKNFVVYSNSEVVLNGEMSNLSKITFSTSNTTFNWNDSSSSIVANNQLSKIVFSDFTTSAKRIQSNLNGLQVYPNPAENEVQIKNAGKSVKIYSLSGQLMKSVHANHPIEKIDISDLKDGMYIIQSGNESKRLIKN